MSNDMVAMSNAMVAAVKKCLTGSKSHEGGKDETLKGNYYENLVAEKIGPMILPAC